MAAKIRIGFAGVGNMGQCAHLKNYVTLPDCEVVAVSDLRPGLAQRVAARYGVPRAYGSAAEMLEHEKLDGLVAVQMFTYNGGLLPGLYRAGIPIFSEKPLAGSVEVGEKLLKALEAGGSWHMVGYHKRSDPATMYARQQIASLKQSGELGKMRYVRLVMPPGDWTANGFTDLITTDEPMPALLEDPPPSDMDRQGYEQYVRFVNYYIHQVNLMRYLLGEPYKVIYAAPSGVLMAVESASGITGVIEMSTYRTTVDWQESFLVTFERGYIKGELPAPMAINRPGRIEMLIDPGNGVTPQVVVPQLPWIHAMRQQAANFVAAIKGEIEPPCQAAEALEDLRIAREYVRAWKGI
jgi:predicted dehydrogenase